MARDRLPLPAEDASAVPRTLTPHAVRDARLRLGRDILIAYAVTWVIGVAYGYGLSRTSMWKGSPWEIAVLTWFHAPLPRWLDTVMLIIPYGGTNLTLLPAILLLGLWLWKRQGKVVTAVHLAVVCVGALSQNVLMKHLLNRDRPAIFEGRGLYAWASYPSGHAILTLALYFTVALQLKLARGWRWPFLVAPVIVLLTCYSRLYLAVHWPTDVLGGLLIGLVWLAGSWTAFTRYVRDTKGDAAVLEIEGVTSNE
jgi:undecaprenyl-diphosphatase